MANVSAKRASQTRAAAMAHATRGRNTRFKSRREVMTRLSCADADDEIADGVEEFRARRAAGPAAG